MEDSPQEAGGAGYDRANPAESSKHRNVTANPTVATNPDSEPASPVPVPSVTPGPLPEHVKAAQRRKIAKGLDGQSGTQPDRDREVTRSVSSPSNVVRKEIPVQSVNPPQSDEASVSVVDIIEPDLFKSITENEARSLVNRIRDHINDARALVLELYEREGWRALGYDSWSQCVVAEFDHSRQHLYRLLDAAKVEKNLSPIGDKPIAESVLRPLARLEPDQQREAWKVATAIDLNPTAEHVARVAKTITKAIEDARADTTGGIVSEAPKQSTKPPKPRVGANVAEYCEVGWILLTAERDFAVLALTPENKQWAKAGRKFWQSLRTRKIVTVS